REEARRGARQVVDVAPRRERARDARGPDRVRVEERAQEADPRERAEERDHARRRVSSLQELEARDARARSDEEGHGERREQDGDSLLDRQDERGRVVDEDAGQAEREREAGSAHARAAAESGRAGERLQARDDEGEEERRDDAAPGRSVEEEHLATERDERP